MDFLLDVEQIKTLVIGLMSSFGVGVIVGFMSNLIFSAIGHWIREIYKIPKSGL